MSSDSDSSSRARLEALIAALRHWQAKKLALDAQRPDFTKDQLRELNAAESRLLAFESDELEAALRRLHQHDSKGVMPSESSTNLESSAAGGVTHPPTNTSTVSRRLGDEQDEPPK